MSKGASRTSWRLAGGAALPLPLPLPLPLRRLRRRLLLRSVLAGAVCCGCGAWLVCVAVAWLLRGCGVCIVQTVAVLTTAILAGGAPSPS